MSKTKLLSLTVICLVLLTFILTFEKKAKADVQYFRVNEAIEETVLKENEQLYFSKKSRSKMQKVHTSEMVTLYCDKETGSIAVYDSTTKKLWRSIPEVYAGVKTGTVVIEVISDGAVYSLYSQVDSTSEKISEEKTIKFIYDFKRVLPNKNEVRISVPVAFSLQSGTLTAELDCSEIKNESKNIILKSVALLPFFGADREKAKNSYLFVPDGSGVTVDLSKNPKEFEPLVVPIYGEDISEVEAQDKKAVIGAFGIKKENSAFVGVIEEGAESAIVKAEKALSETGLNRVSAYFEITPSAETEDGKLAVSKISYKGKLSISYRFLSMQNSDYIGMASAAREILIRNASLPMTSYDSSGEYPFNLSIIGVGYDENAEQARIFTSYSQTYDILSAIKAKGIGGINLRYRGLFDGGINQRNIAKSDLALGNTNELRELSEYAKGQNIRVFADVKLITASKKDGFSNRAVALDGNYTSKKAGKFESYESELVSPKEISNANSKMLIKLRDTDFDGICFADAGKYIYSDFSKTKGVLSSETASILKKELSSASANKTLMIDTGNLYSVKFASSVINLPSTSFYKERELCSTVPFVEAVYHGFFDYSLTPINTAKNSETMFLRSVEYGAVPHFEWCYADSSTEEDKDKYNYSNSINEAQLYYQRMSSGFSDLRDARITAHSKVKKNVYMTEYEGSTKVYVNYNKTPATVDGVTIEPRSFVRVG